MFALFFTFAPVQFSTTPNAAVQVSVGPEASFARAKLGGRSFKMSRPAPTRNTSPNQMGNQRGSFSRGLAGGLLGGALGGLLFGSMFGMGGQGFGILPILLLAGGAWYLWRRFGNSQNRNRQGQWNYPGGNGAAQSNSSFGGVGAPDIGSGIGGLGQTASYSDSNSLDEDVSVEEGLAQIKRYDRSFDPNYFTEVASDVFFQVQAGWMRRDITSFQHLLGSQLADEYAAHFAEMKEKGIINKLESIAIRGVDIVAAGSDGREDFVTVRFTANLLDYTVNDTTGDVVSGDMTTPVKFDESWTWARPTGTQEWRLEGIA